jgi:predicted neuraminidase
MKTLLPLLVFSVANLFTVHAAVPPAVIVRAEIINPGAPYPECHASTIVESAPGHLVAAWFGGTKERNPDVCIFVSRFEAGQWTPGVMVADGLQPEGAIRLPTWNPVLFAPKDAPLQLFYKVGPTPRDWWGMVITSSNGGREWSAPRRLPDGILGPIKNKPVVLPDGSWLSPTSTEGNKSLTGDKDGDGWLVHFERTRDAGATWEKIGPVKKGPGFDAIQPSILFHSDGRLQALSRTKQGVIAQTWSKDGGQTWTPLTAIELPNPNSGTDAVTLADGRQLLVYNHSAHRADEAKGDRCPLDVAVSSDGVVWRRAVTLETEPCKSGYAYPAVIQAADGLVHITYTVNREVIKHVVLDPAKL